MLNQIAVDNLSKNSNPDCGDVLNMAYRELASFFGAVMSLFGAEQAELSAEDWLHEVEAADPLPASNCDWRRITLNVTRRLASRVNASSMTTHAKAYAAEVCR